jgi:hypothetical protein
MYNLIKSILQIGNNTQINTINYDAKISTSIKRIEKDFNNGNIREAMKDLSSLIEENNANQKIKYQLLVQKTSFMFSLRRYDEAKKLLRNLEKNYSDFIDVAYEELKLIDLSLERQEKIFFELVDKMIAEAPKPLNRTKFELMYYLNTRDTTRAKEIFENLKEEEQQFKEYALMGGYLYSDLNDYEKADFFYQIALSQDIPFLDKSTIVDFYGTDIINKYMYGQKLNDSYHQKLVEYKKVIETILDQEKYFDNAYIENLKINYLFILLVLDDIKKYIKFYEQYAHIERIFIYHYVNWCNLIKAPINHEMIQERIQKNKNDLILNYCSLLEQANDDSKNVISFLEANEMYIFESQYVFLFYIQAKVFFKETLEDKFKDFLVANKYKNIEYLLAYLLITEQNSYSQEDIKKLIEFVMSESQILKRILESLDILMQGGYKKEYIDLALKKQNEFPKVIEKTLELLYQDKDLTISEFESFLENIDMQETHIIGTIADIYVNFNAYNKSFEYFYMLYKQGNNDKAILLKMIEVAFRHFQKTNGVLNMHNEKEIYDNLVAIKDELDLRELIFLLQYSLVVLKDSRQILPTLNSKLLNIDIESLDEDIKIELSNLYIQTTIGMNTNFNALFLYEDNICYEKDGKTYLKGYEVAKKNKKNFGFYVVDRNSFFAIKNDPLYKQSSIFHRIVGPFAYKVDNPNMIPIKVNTDAEKPFEELFSFIEEISQHEKDLFQRYTQEEFYGLYPLAKYDYANYFTLIPFLLEHQNYSLSSLKPSFIIDKKKILTLSSIIFLNHLGYLNEVLKMKNIVIQQTTINWLQKYIEDYLPINRPTDFSYMDEEKPKFIPYTEEDNKKAIAFKDELVDLTKKLLEYEIIDDTNENLPIADAYKMLAREMGEQEYHALAYCINHNYQIISENNIFEMLFDTIGYNKLFISNSFALLVNILDTKDIYHLEQKLFDMNYRYVSNCPEMKRILEGLNYQRFKEILNDHLTLKFKVWYEYGCLDDLIKKYINTYKVLYPKTILPKKDVFSENIEYLLEILK